MLFLFIFCRLSKYFFHFMEIILWKNKKNRALLPCFSYSHTPLTESKNIFLIFVRDEIPYFRFISFYLPLGLLSVFIYHLPARLRARTTRIIRYAHASNANGHTASPIGVSYGSSRSPEPPELFPPILRGPLGLPGLAGV